MGTLHMAVLQVASDETTIPEALVNTVVAMATVFSVLIMISLVIYLMKFIPKLLDRSAKKEEAPVMKAEPAPVVEQKAAPAPVAAPATDDTQLVAVITAAIYAAMEEEGTPVPAGGLVIRSIKKRY